MAAGEVRGGLAALDAIGWVHEDGADYLERAADSYIRLTQNGADLESAIAITPTWAENHRLTEAIRSRLREHNQIAPEGIDFTVHDSFRWTEQQKRNAANYSAGQSIVFTRPFGDWRPGDSAEVRSVADGGVTVVANGEESPLPIKIKDCFDVGRFRQVEVATGDKLLIRANQKRLGLINGQVLTLDRIEPDGSIVTREGLRIPSGFRQWCHGHVVTSHKSQGRTHKHVIVAAERLDAKSTYVGCSRGKLTCTIHTPDKHYLQEHLPEGTRRAALDVLSESLSQSPDGTASRTITVGISASKKLGSTAAQQVAETAKPRWSERIRKRILKNIQLFQRHRFITERRRAALEIAAKQTQSQPQRLNAQKERPSVRMRVG